jgi:hypothetical protein
MWKSVLLVLLTMVAIGAGVVAQPVLAILFPAIENHTVGGLRADSYVPCIVGSLLCGILGYQLGMRMRSGRTAALLAAFPVIWIGLSAWILRSLGATTFVVNPFSVCIILTGIMPLLGVLAGWAFAGFRLASSHGPWRADENL